MSEAQLLLPPRLLLLVVTKLSLLKPFFSIVAVRAPPASPVPAQGGMVSAPCRYPIAPNSFAAAASDSGDLPLHCSLQRIFRGIVPFSPEAPYAFLHPAGSPSVKCALAGCSLEPQTGQGSPSVKLAAITRPENAATGSPRRPMPLLPCERLLPLSGIFFAGGIALLSALRTPPTAAALCGTP